MSFLQIVTANVLSISITVLFLLWMSGILLGRIPGSILLLHAGRCSCILHTGYPFGTAS